MKSIGSKKKHQLAEGDILKRKNKFEYTAIKSFYHEDNINETIYVEFNGFSVPQNSVSKFFETHENNNDLLLIYGE